MTTQDQRLRFYRETLEQRIAKRSSKVLVLAAGPRDKQVFDELGYTNVTFSNVDETYGGVTDFEPHAFSQLDTAKVLASLDRVDESFQAPVALFYLQDCSYKQIADILGLPLGTVKSRISRGIGQLQKLLAKDLPQRKNKTQL